jgi:HSP20 family protein
MTIADRSQQTADWAGSPISTLHPAVPGVLGIPVEQYPDGTRYVVRFELPGVDPERDLRVTIETGTLMVRAQRRESGPEGRQSEFRYGTMARHVALPLGSNARDVTASYQHGILTVRIGMEPEHQQEPWAVPVSVEA